MEPCNVCGGTDVNLVDGFYYCVECGTQDVNARETIVEQTVVGDGTFAHTTTRKITIIKEGIEMSSEWHKWHMFNFILAGLTDELIALGAKPSIKMKVLWIWSRYIKQFQVKDDTLLEDKLDIGNNNSPVKDRENSESEREDNNDDESENNSKGRTKKKNTRDTIVREIQTIKKGTLLAILYVALNLDRSDIQLSHLFRFIREGRLSLNECMKFVPKELKLKAVKNWISFINSHKENSPLTIRKMGMNCFKILKLGVPLVPDLRKLVKNHVKEMCLPDDVKDLIFGLMHFMPIDFLNINAKMQESLTRIPDYEGICMGYLLVALKISFGLDDDYELKISEEVDRMNHEENYLKSYKLGMFSEPCDRLFSFREWCQHLQFRKYILSRNYLPMSRQFNTQTDDCVFIEHLEKRRKRETKLSDDVTMDILNKIRPDQEFPIISKSDFPVTLTPMTTYIDAIAQHVQDPDLRLLLCEDFTQYSLRYAIKDMKLPDFSNDKDNPIVGVSRTGKTFNKFVEGTLTELAGDMTMVYVRNCQNKNWLKTEPPKIHHITKNCNDEDVSDKDSDHGYDSNIENPSPKSATVIDSNSDETIDNNDKTLTIVDDSDTVKCIFDDNFNDILYHTNDTMNEDREDYFEMNTKSNLSIQDSKDNLLDNAEHFETSMSPMQFDHNALDRDSMIKELIELACKTHKIPIPKQNDESRQRKRKVSLVKNETSASEPKKKRTVARSKPGEAKLEIDNLISTYYNNLRNDYLNKISQQVKSMIENKTNILNKSNAMESQNEINNTTIMNSDIDIHNSNVPHVDDVEKSRKDIDPDNSVIESNMDVNKPNEPRGDDTTSEESEHDDIIEKLFPKTDPKFDEKDHDIRQLYVKLENHLDTHKTLLSDIESDLKLDGIIKKSLEKISNIGENTLDEKKNSVFIDETDVVSDSDDDTPLSVLKEIGCLEKENMERENEILEPLIGNTTKVKMFNYWIRHYKSKCVIKALDLGKKFDNELKENLPISFVFVIRECAAILGCSAFSVYRNMQNIEEILIANNY